MSMKAAGYKCPFCGYDHEMNIIAFVRDETMGFYVAGADLECPECSYQWRTINWE